ncbi:MAG: methionine biosynthesis protein MetW [Acetobacterales bacterium]
MARDPIPAGGRPAVAPGKIRRDLQLVADMVAPRTRVLDVGCGDGALLDYLDREKQVDGRGIEIDNTRVADAVAQGLSVIQGDAETDLPDFPDGAFDYVILSQTLQAMREPKTILEDLLRIGRRAIVSFPNFGHWAVRLQVMFRGRMPQTRALDDPWYATPNIHLCTIADFEALCDEMGIEVERRVALTRTGRPGLNRQSALANLLSEQAVYLLRRGTRGSGSDIGA